MQNIYIALGTNVGDRLHNLSNAIILLKNNNIRIKNTSKIYETPPMYATHQPHFLNMAIYGETGVCPHTLLNTLKDIEVQVGRTKTYTNGPRVIDLDILYYGDILLDTDTLHIPHMRIQERQFVLQPMQDLNPHHMDVRTQKTITQMANDIPIDKNITVYTQTL